MSDTLGPFSWPTVATLPMLSLADKRLFWDARRKAVGGRSVETAGSASGEDDNDDDDEESEGEAPAVLPDAENMAEEKKAESEPVVATPAAGGGCGGSKVMADHVMQPICWHQAPPLVADSLCHAFWAKSVIDMTPGAGDLAVDSILQERGYVGICQSEFQKTVITDRVKKAYMKAMGTVGQKAYSAAYAKEYGGEATEPPAKKLKPDAPKKDPASKSKPKAKTAPVLEPLPLPSSGDAPAAPKVKTRGAGKPASAPSEDLSDRLKAMLEAAKQQNQK